VNKEKKQKNPVIKLDEDIIKTLDGIIDEVGDTTKSVFKKVTDLVIKKGSETLTNILEKNKIILKEKIKSKGKINEEKKDI
jgi:hypothetical protein